MQLRYPAFVDRLATGDENSATWAETLAGLLVLRVAALRFGAHESSSNDAEGLLRATSEAVGRLDPQRPLYNSLTIALADLGSGGPSPRVENAAGILAYAHELEHAAEWLLALDVYDAIIADIHPSVDYDAVITALIRRGACLRLLGRFDEALDVYGVATEEARERHDRRGDLRADLGRTLIAGARGNMPQADSLLREILEQTEDPKLAEVRSFALHELAYVSIIRGAHADAVRYAYDALGCCVATSEREGILGDLAAALILVGERAAGRDALTILVATARDSRHRWSAQVNLLQMAAEDALRGEFEQLRQHLAEAELPPRVRADVELHLGRGYQLFGEWTAASGWLERALTHARAYQLNRIAFEAEAALGRNKEEDLPAPVQRTASANPEIARIAREVRSLRKSSLALPSGESA